jgi:predicted methyltransferase
VEGSNVRIIALSAVSIAVAAASLTSALAAKFNVDPALAAVIANPARNEKASARDPVRHPAEVLSFFGLNRRQNVVELWPGGGYWTEILGPYLAARGHYTAALPAADDAEEGPILKAWRERIAAHKDRYGTIVETKLVPDHFDIAPPGSADLVLTFRNLHNWMGGDYAPKVLEACFKALKPGGILGIEEHRGRIDQPQDPKAKSGYVREDYAIGLIKAAGFELVGRSEVNANPKDTKDWPEGVWTLPPTLTLGDKDRAKYIAIGESDNFVLKFKKPKRR